MLHQGMLTIAEIQVTLYQATTILLLLRLVAFSISLPLPVVYQLEHLILYALSFLVRIA